MLKIINDLRPFFEDCYRRVSVREYAKLRGISPPTASKLLNSYTAEGLLLREEYRNYLFFSANKESRDFIDLSRTYWRQQLSGLVALMEKNLTDPAIVLFGSLSKAEAKKDSDIDIAVFAHKKPIDVSGIERKLKRRLQLFWFSSFEGVDKNLANNIVNGYVLRGRLI